MKSKVYFSKISGSRPEELSIQAKNLLEKIVTKEGITLKKDLPIKIHPGAIGNNAYLRPEIYSGIISYLKSIQIDPHFIETCMSSEKSTGKENEFVEHGFEEIPYVIADGPNGDESVAVPNAGGKHFPVCLIAKKLAEAEQVLVVTHFKGHGMAGFGGAIKMLGIGFASGIGKTTVHSTKPEVDKNESIDWDKAVSSSKKDEFNIHDWNPEVVSVGTQFRERVAEYATAAAKGKDFVYLTFAINLSPDCDCIGEEMTPLYPDLGIFVSTDPVAIDKAVMDILAKRENKVPFAGSEIFSYAEKLGLGSIDYELIEE